MALDKQVVSIPIAGGLDTKTDPKIVGNGKLTALENGVFTKAGTILKRNGYDKLSQSILTGGSISLASKLSTFQNELLLLSNSKLYSYSTHTSSWVDKGTISNVDVNSNLLASSNSVLGTSFPDQAAVNGVKVVAWCDGTLILASVIDVNTGVEYLSNYTLYGALNPFKGLVRVVSAGNSIFVLFVSYDGVDNNLYYVKLDTTTPNVFSAPTILVNHNVTNTNSGLFDCVSKGNTAVVVWYKGSTNDIELIEFNSSGATVHSNNVTADNVNALALCYDSSDQSTYVTFSRIGHGVQYVVVDSTLTVTLVVTTIDPSASPLGIRLSPVIESNGVMRVFWDYYNTYGSPQTPLSDFSINTATATKLGIVAVTIPLIRQLAIASKAFVYNGVSYVLGRSNSTLQSTYYLIDSTGRIAAKSSLNGANPANSALTAEIVPSVINLSAGKYTIVQDVQVKLLTAANSAFAQNNVATIDFDFLSTKIQNSKEVNKNLLITGGYASMYDGSTASEFGFNVFPETMVTTINAAGTGSIGVGTYVYYAVYQWVDAQGNTHRSAPSTGAIVTLAAGTQSVTINVPTLRLTTKQNVSVVFYRTLAGGVTPHKLLARPNGFPSTVQNPQPNNTSVDYVTYIDENADSSIASGEILYTTGGVVDNIVPPACKSIEVFKNRVILSGLEDDKSFWYSKQILNGEGIGFNDAFYLRIDTQVGGINATKTMDDKLVIFKDNVLFAMVGDGPLDTGEQNDFSTPQLVSTDVGCPYPDSLVLMPTGIMFKSSKGIYHLDRAFRVTYLGAPVESYNSEFITSAILLEDKNQVRFLTSSGSALVYDYYFDQWGTFTNHIGVDACSWVGVYTYAKSDGSVYKENSTSFTDNGSAITLKMSTAWLKFSSVEGYQRIRRFSLLGNYYSPHTLTVGVSYGYNDTIVDSYTFNTTTGIIAPDTVYQFRGHISNQKSDAIKFTFDDSVTGAPGQGYSLNDLSLEVGIKRGIVKLPAIKSVG